MIAIRRLAPVLALALVLASLGGCGRVRHQVQRIKRIETEVELFAGTVRAEGVEKGRIVVAALPKEKGGGRAVGAGLARGPEGSFLFVAPAGARRLFAFVDEDGDHRWAPPEPAAVAPASNVDPGAKRPGAPVELVIRRGANPPGVGSVDATVLALDAGPTEPEPRVGLVTDLSAARYEPAGVSAGMWDVATFYARYGPSLALLEPYDPARLPVLFVHGAGGYPQNFTKLIAGLDRARFQPWVFHYASGASIELSAAFLDRALAELQGRLRPERIFLVAHSMGGLVSRRMMLDRLESGRPLGIERFVTLASPWMGAWGAGRGVKRSPVVMDMWRDMDPDGELVGHLFDRRLPDSVCVGLLFGHAGNNRLMPETNDGTVSIESVLRPEAQAEARFVRGFNTDHDGILSDAGAAEAVALLLGEEGPCRGAAPVARSAR